MLDVMNQLLNMSSRLTDRTKQKMLELFNRSCLGQMRPSMPMSGVPGMLPGAGLGHQYHQLYQQQAAYPGIQPGYPGGTYPNQKARLLAGQVTAPPQPPPPKPVLPLKNLCQFPIPGNDRFPFLFLIWNLILRSYRGCRICYGDLGRLQDPSSWNIFKRRHH